MKKVKVEYDASANVLRLVEPLEGVADHTKLDATLEEPPVEVHRPWLALEGSLKGEDGEDFARAINELFPPWNSSSE